MTTYSTPLLASGMNLSHNILFLLAVVAYIDASAIPKQGDEESRVAIPHSTRSHDYDV